MAESDWLSELDRPGSRDHLEALGAFALIHNRLETCLYTFIKYFVGGVTPATALYLTLHNRGRVDLIKAYIGDEKDDRVRVAVLAAMGAIDVCIENRNLLLHGLPVAQINEHLSLWKAARGKQTLQPYSFTLAQIREAAVGAERARDHAVELVAWLTLREQKPGKKIPLPETPPQPRKLSLSRLQATRKGAPSQPQS